jgi:hypothetical protein
METSDVLQSLRLINRRTGHKHQIGVYAADTIPRKFHKPAAFVVNTAVQKEYLGHWTAFYISKDNSLYYFDSFGTQPFQSHYQRWIKSRDFKNINFNSKRYQASTSDVCGKYCIVFLSKFMGYKVVKSDAFGSNYMENDRTINAAYKHILKLL